MEKINSHIFGVTYHLTDTIPLNVYLVKGADKTVLIDSGINKMHESLMQMLADTDSQLHAILNTHSHHDHIGGNGLLKKETGCEVVAPKAYAHWHHDWQASYLEFARPFPDIFPDSEALREEVWGILDMPHKVDQFCGEGDVWSLGGEVELECLMFSGHMLEEVGWLETKTKTLILGDVVTLLDAPFIHGHLTVSGYRASLARLKKLTEADMFETVLMAHFPPMDKTAFIELINRASNYIDLLENTVLASLQEGMTGLEDIWLSCIKKLGKQREFRSLSTVFAHLKDLEERAIIVKSNGEFRLSSKIKIKHDSSLGK